VCVLRLIFCAVLCFFLLIVSLVVSIAAVDCLERPVSKVMYSVSRGSLNAAHLFTLHK